MRKKGIIVKGNDGMFSCTCITNILVHPEVFVLVNIFTAIVTFFISLLDSLGRIIALIRSVAASTGWTFTTLGVMRYGRGNRQLRDSIDYFFVSFRRDFVQPDDN